MEIVTPRQNEVSPVEAQPPATGAHASTQNIVSVAAPPLAKALTYSVPPEYGHCVVGSEVQIPLGRRTSYGFVIGTDHPAPKGMSIKSILGAPATPCFSETQLQFFRWVAEYYSYPLSQVLELAVPQRYAPRPCEQITLAIVEKEPRGATQRKILDVLRSAGGVLLLDFLKQSVPHCTSALRALEKQGAVSRSFPEDIPDAAFNNDLPPIDLTPDQKIAYEAVLPAVQQQQYKTYLLHGVTGSGKTEVYVDLVRAALRLGRGALIIVPEIALTPQLVERFEARLGSRIGVLHSGLKGRERWEAWQALLDGRIRIALGARSAVFAPVENLGLVVVDEEHDASFKQADGLRYNARDLALVRGKLSNCPVVLGSATPSLESYFHAKQGRYTYLGLPKTHHIGNLSWEVVDLGKVKSREMRSSNISPRLFDAIAEALSRGEQIFLLYNKRGFATFLQCTRCQATVGCPHCSVTLTYYQRRSSAICHYCGYSSPTPVVCAACGMGGTLTDEQTPTFAQRGAGTERIYDEVRELFPEARVTRLDRDAVTSSDETKEILERVRKGEIDILVGTQMIAKGHDLPSVTLVGVVDCDVGLNFPDFRASERIFQLLTQVGGRAGRRTAPGLAILQTRSPHHPSIERTVRRDYIGFAESELERRRELAFPPFARAVRIIASASTREEAFEALGPVVEFVRANWPNVRVLGPAFAPIEKIRRWWRSHALLMSTDTKSLLMVVRQCKSQLPFNKNLRIVFDIDPQDML